MEDVAMRTYDFSPLWRSTVGFDRMFDLINNEVPNVQDTYPPYDIARGELSHLACSRGLYARAGHRRGSTEPADGFWPEARQRESGVPFPKHRRSSVRASLQPRRPR